MAKARKAPAGLPKRRLSVTVTTPDGPAVPARGLAAWLASAAPARARGEVTVALISDGRMRSLNRTFRGKDDATDVLSFPAVTAAEAKASAVRTGPNVVPRAEALASARDYLGDIVIATGVAARQARDAGHSIATEVRVLALHGLLHLLGYDHDSDAGTMARVENRLRKKAGLKEGLIARRSR